MKKHLFLMAGLLLAFLFSSCSMLDDAGENQSADVALELSSELLQAVTSRTASARDVAEGEQVNCLVEVNLKGAYSSKKSISIPAANPSSKEITFERIPVGKKLSAEVIIYKVRKSSDGQSSKTKVFKGKSDEITVKRGSNRITIKTINYYKDYPVSITLGFKNAEALPAQTVSIEAFAFKKGSAEIEDFYKRFIAGSCDFADYSAFLAKANADNEGYAAWATSTSTAQTSGISIDTNANQISLSGNMKLSQNENLVLVAFAKFTPANPALAPDGIIYAAYADVSSLSALNETAFVPGLSPQSISLKMNKVKQELYALYNYNSQNPDGAYEYYITTSIDNFSKTNVTPMVSSVNSFTYDSKGNIYILTSNNGDFVKSASRTVQLNLIGHDGGGGEVTVSPKAITVDTATDTMYAYYADSNWLYIFKIPDLISSGNGNSSGDNCKESMNFSNVQSSNLAQDNDKLVVHNGIAYGIGCTGSDVFEYTQDDNDEDVLKFYKIDLSQAAPVAENLNLDYKALGIPPRAAVRDILCQDGAIYLLIGEMGAKSTYIASRGAIVKYDITSGAYSITNLASTNLTNGFRTASKYNNSIVCDYSTELTASNYKAYLHTEFFEPLNESAPNNSFFINAPFDNTQNTSFAGPQKFIAIKPKKLVIADSGYAFYTNAASVISKKKVNRVAEIDLESLSMQNAVMKNVAVEFKNNSLQESTSGPRVTITVPDGNPCPYQFFDGYSLSGLNSGSQYLTPYFPED